MTEWVRIAGWVLLHFLWQGALVVILAAGALRVCRRAPASIRYTVAVFALSTMVAAPMLTAFALASASGTGVPPPLPSRSVDAPQDVTNNGILEALQSTLTPATGVAAIEAYFPMVVSLWSGGATILLLAAFRSWWHIRRLHAAALAWAPSSWQAPANRLAQRLGLRKVVRVVEFPSIDVPAVLGCFRPVVILPLAVLAQLSAEHVEAILAHELAHVRRHDYVVNLLQRLAEAVLFYHPGIWWISARIREEREHCCDDLAIEVCGDRDAYAVALAELESRRTAAVALAVAATDGALLKRIRRILQVATPELVQPPNWALTMALASVFAVVLGGPQRSPALLAQATISVADALAPPFRAGWSSASGSGSITSTGAVVFTEDLRDIASISSGGSIAVESRGFLSSRRVEVEGIDGSLRRKYYVNGSERPWTDESARWLSDELAFLVRRSGVSANERVRQVLAAKGVTGVLDEIRLLYTDSVRGLYFRALFETGGLAPVDLDAAFRLAGDLIDSSAELSQSLQAAIAAGLHDSDGFFYAASRVSSSMEKSRLLTALLGGSELSAARQVDFLATAATIESNAACAAVLDGFATRYHLADKRVRSAFLEALKTVDSNFERDRLLEKIVTDVR